MTATIIEPTKQPGARQTYRAECKACRPTARFPFHPHWRALTRKRRVDANDDVRYHNKWTHWADATTSDFGKVER